LILVLRFGLLGLRGALALGCCFLPRPLLDYLLSHFSFGQSRFRPPQFFRQLVAPLAAVSTVFFLIRSLGLLQQLFYFFLQHRLVSGKTA
jgi:hypothetical protein